MPIRPTSAPAPTPTLIRNASVFAPEALGLRQLLLLLTQLLLQLLQTLEQHLHRNTGVIARLRFRLCTGTFSQAYQTGFDLVAVAAFYPQRAGSRLL